MPSIDKNKSILFKFLSIFSVVRIHNILIIVLAQYLTSIFILSEKEFFEVVLDYSLFLLIICSSISIASGYIINNFYDDEKDLINRPIRYKIDKVVKKSTKLNLYFFLNFCCVFFAYLISWRAVLFFSVYIFFLWLYSHKLKKILFVGNFISSLLTITPFFAILLYYKNIDMIIFVYSLFLFFIILTKDITKDLENIKGDFTLNYKTLPVIFGERFTKLIVGLMIVINIFLIINLILNFNQGLMYYYYYFSLLALLVFLIKLTRSSNKNDYLFLHNILRLIIVVGVFCIVLIKPSIL